MSTRPKPPPYPKPPRPPPSRRDRNPVSEIKAHVSKNALNPAAASHDNTMGDLRDRCRAFLALEMDELPCRLLSCTSNTRTTAFAPLNKPKIQNAAPCSSSWPTTGGATPSDCAS
jgi:hypothetical protein